MFCTCIVYVKRNAFFLQFISVDRLCARMHWFCVYVNVYVMHRMVANVYVYASAYVYKHSLYETPNRRNMKSDRYQCVHVYVYV